MTRIKQKNGLVIYERSEREIAKSHLNSKYAITPKDDRYFIEWEADTLEEAEEWVDCYLN